MDERDYKAWQKYLEEDTTVKYDATVYTPPFRLGRKSKRAILDANGNLVMVFPTNNEKQAELYCKYLNNK